MSLALTVCALVIGVLAGTDRQLIYLKRMKQAGPATCALQNSNPHVTWGRAPKSFIFFWLLLIFLLLLWLCVLICSSCSVLACHTFVNKKEEKNTLIYFKEGLNGIRNAQNFSFFSFSLIILDGKLCFKFCSH